MRRRQNLVDIESIIYQKNPFIEYEIKDDRVFIISTQNHWIQFLLRKLNFKIPKKTYLELDEYGSFVFQQINGKTTIYTIGQKLALQHKGTEGNLYERLTLYLSVLENDKKYINKINSKN